MQQHNVWGTCMAFSVGGYVGLNTKSKIPPHIERHTHTPHVMLLHHHNWPFKKFLNSVIFKFIDFNKEPTGSLKMIWIKTETCWSVFECFNINILD